MKCCNGNCIIIIYNNNDYGATERVRVGSSASLSEVLSAGETSGDCTVVDEVVGVVGGRTGATLGSSLSFLLEDDVEEFVVGEEEDDVEEFVVGEEELDV